MERMRTKPGQCNYQKRRSRSFDLIGYVELTGKASVMAAGEIENYKNGFIWPAKECQSSLRGKPKEKQYEDLVSRIDRRLEGRGTPFNSYACICRVPPKLRRVNEEAYTPQVVSIGPFHHGKENLKQMENQKLEYLHNFFERPRIKGIKGWDDFVRHIKENEAYIRECYLDSLDDFSSDKFAEMILLDAIFILELFLRMDDRHKSPYQEKDFDHIVDRGDPLYQIQEDLILLENQLPFFLLKQLHSLAFPDPDCPNEFFHLTANFFKNYTEELKPESTTSKDIYFDGFTHFTDFLRERHLGRKFSCREGSHRCGNCSKYQPDSCFIPVSSNNQQQSGKNSEANDASSPAGTPLLYSATKLREAGVKFREVKSNFLEIRFDNGKLEIPNFNFYDVTECILRNIMALEQCFYPGETYICHYAVVLDYLINTARDVELLVEKKIMRNMLGDHQRAANVINKLCLHIGPGGNDRYSELIEALNAYYEVPSHSWKATLRHEYFRTPWRSASTLAAFLLLLLTLTETICTIIQTTSKK